VSTWWVSQVSNPLPIIVASYFVSGEFNIFRYSIVEYITPVKRNLSLKRGHRRFDGTVQIAGLPSLSNTPKSMQIIYLKDETARKGAYCGKAHPREVIKYMLLRNLNKTTAFIEAF
jgi:hypothetical protein